MEKKLLKNNLKTLGADFLAERLIQLSMHDHALAQELEFIVLKNDPQELAKKITQQINSLKRSARFIPWNETLEFTNGLYQISRSIENDLLPNSSTLAIECIEKFFSIDKNIYERVDDSHGEVGLFYGSLSRLWGDAWLAYTDRNPSILAEKIYYLLKNNGYASKDHIIMHSANALDEAGLAVLEKLINENENLFCKYSLSWIYEAIADASGDTDKYIQVVKKYSVINENTVCDIAARLIKKQRTEEAIDWLLHQPHDVSLKDKPNQFNPEKVSYSKRFGLLIDAYETQSMTKEAQTLRWLLFEKTLSKQHYDALIKHQPSQEIEATKKRAYQFACEKFNGCLDTLLEFLSEIQVYNKLDSIIQEKNDDIGESNYYLYRPLSKTLASAGYFVSASLLRRKLIHGILNKAQSKHYKYAVSDLNIARRFSKEITDWGNFETHAQYIEELKTLHKRKSAFWSKVGDG
jgi:hypothetical protein